MTDLITIDELTAQTNSSRIHVAYLTKLGILPNAVKRKIGGKLVGCYPKDSINEIIGIQQMKNQGMTYSQIAKTLNSVIPGLTRNDTSLNQNNNLTSQGYQLIRNPSFLYLIIGLLFGFLLSTLNSQSLARLQTQANLTETASVPAPRNPPWADEAGKSNVYLISIPEQNLDKLDKTNINYLISN